MKTALVSRLLSTLGAVALIVSLYVPLWRIELDAPQYPEGLSLQIYPSKIGGDVDIINGLNHYIGMQTLHASNFIEFTILPYIIGLYALFILSTLMIKSKKYLYIVFGAFVLFGIIAMADFWRWEYDYGHNLDPNAAIKVPGMSYQPPLIGFKQLLNFGAYSIPDIGGWLFIGCGLLLLIAVLNETGTLSRIFPGSKTTLIVTGIILFSGACTPRGPVNIQLNKDECGYCKMTITELRFAGELITAKNRVYKFDDIKCLKKYISENAELTSSSVWISDYTKPGTWINLDSAVLLRSEMIKSPMGGSVAAYADETEATPDATLWKVPFISWKDYLQQ